MTKEICEKCEFTEESHKIFEKDPMEYHGLKKPCEKFKAKNNSPLENVGVDQPSKPPLIKGHEDKEPEEKSYSEKDVNFYHTSGSDNKSRFQNHINVIKEAKRIKDGSDNHSPQSETETQVVNDRIRIEDKEPSSVRAVAINDNTEKVTTSGSDDDESLSDKKKFHKEDNVQLGFFFYPEEDVKEAAKKLKYKINLLVYKDEMRLDINEEILLLKEIDKIFGSFE